MTKRLVMFALCLDCIIRIYNLINFNKSIFTHHIGTCDNCNQYHCVAKKEDIKIKEY